MQSAKTKKRQNLKRSRSFAHEMPVTDPTVLNSLADCIIFPVEKIVQYPLPGYGAPTSISFSLDDSLVTYLFSSDYSLNRKVFTFDLKTCKQELVFSPPDGGLDESNISTEEKLRRERLRERGLGVTKYEWVKMSSKKKTIMVPLPAGIYFQDLSLQPELKLPSTASSPIIDPHLSPDGTMLAYVRDYELHVLNLLYNESKQLTFGTGGNVLTHGLAEYIAQDGSLIMPLYEQSFTVPRFKRLQLEPPEMIQIQANDGTVLYGALYKPDIAKFGPPPYKTLISVYGGPSVKLVSDSWMNTVDMRAQFFRSKGILVWKLDNRGTACRGLKFEGSLKYNVGCVDTKDQLTGAEWLIKQGLANADHIGLYGWSYGGYLSAMTLARFPDVFRCAVSGAPVTSWDGYNTFYTEKYMGLPSENREGYELSSAMHHVDNIKGKLLLVHGMIDENVHFRHTSRLVNALVAAGKFYELLIFPDERHMPCRLRTDCIWRRESGTS